LIRRLGASQQPPVQSRPSVSPNAVASMGGATGTAGTAVAVPLLRKIRQKLIRKNKVLLYHILVKKILKLIGDLVLLI